MPSSWKTLPCLLPLLGNGAGVAALISDDQGVKVEIFEWQGCPDCVVFGERLSEFGLQRGLGSIMNLTVNFRDGSHPGVEYDGKLHAWAACASKLQIGAQDADGFWYQTIACVHSLQQSIEECVEAVGMPQNLSDPMLTCVKGPSAKSLVQAMHTGSAAIDDFPWVLVNSKAMPPPDMDEDRVEPVVRAICVAAGKSRAALVPACQEDSFLELRRARLMKGPHMKALRRVLKKGVFLQVGA